MNKRNGILTSVVIGTAVALAGVFLYRRSGRNWTDDMEMAKGWMADRAQDVKDGIQYGKDEAQKAIAKTESASRDLLAQAKELGNRSSDSAKELAGNARANLS